MQNQHLIDLESRKIREIEKLYPMYDKDMFSMMHALAKFRKYLLGGHFVFTMDHNSFIYFLE
jgi:hypothetical protein